MGKSHSNPKNLEMAKQIVKPVRVIQLDFWEMLISAKYEQPELAIGSAREEKLFFTDVLLKASWAKLNSIYY